MLKNVLHKGYWKYKAEHFIEKDTSVDSASKKNKESCINGFNTEIAKCMTETNQMTALEEKYAHTDRFKFKDGDLAKYEVEKADREAKRLQRRREQEEAIRIEQEKKDKERAAE